MIYQWKRVIRKSLVDDVIFINNFTVIFTDGIPMNTFIGNIFISLMVSPIEQK